MKNQSDVIPVATAITIGTTLWLVSAVMADKREAWDTPQYWAVAYPVAMAVCAVLGRAYPTRPWRWALWLFESQLVAMCVRNGELGNLFPLGMLLFAVIALPGMLLAILGARFGRRL
jgi:membrane protein YdbS with pleckstrin-like domain